jgi:hypothetical protein
MFGGSPVKRIILISSVLAIVLAAPVAAQKSDNAISIAAKPANVVFSKATTISGQLTGTGNASVSVELEGQGAPYTSGYKTVGASVMTDATGAYSFTVTPQLSTRYRVKAKTSPPTTSGETTVLVALKVGSRVSDATPTKGQTLIFFGSVWPAHDGKVASLQRKTSSGWKTVATATTIAAPPVNGVTRSRYSIARKVRANGTYRVTVASGDTDHADGRSRTRKVRVH